MDSGDELVLGVDHGIGGLGQGGLQETQQHGVALRGLEAPQAPGIVLIAPPGQEAARGGVHLGQGWPVGEAERLNGLQPLEQAEEDGR